MSHKPDDIFPSDTDADSPDRDSLADDLCGRPAGEGGESEVESLQRQVSELRDRELRAMAEMRNVQQRARREKEEALKFAESSFARELLSVLDGLELAMDAVNRGADARSVGDGVRIVFDQFKKVLTAHHIEPIDAIHQPFDPNVHEAMMQQPSGDVPPGTVLQQLARGYRMYDRVLRAAKVVVSRSPD